MPTVWEMNKRRDRPYPTTAFNACGRAMATVPFSTREGRGPGNGGVSPYYSFRRKNGGEEWPITRVVDSDSLIRIQIPHFKWIRIRIRNHGFDEQNFFYKNTADFFISFVWSKIAIYWSLGVHKGRPSCRRSLQPSKENIQHFKRWILLAIFYFCPPGSGYGSRDPIESGLGGLNITLFN